MSLNTILLEFWYYLVILESELKVKVIHPALTLLQHCTDWTETSFLIHIINQILDLD